MRNVLLWIIAVVLMAGTVVYQRLTGPTHPMRGRVTVAGKTFAYRLVRSGTTEGPAQVVIPDPGRDVTARLRWRRFRTQDPWTVLDMLPRVKEGQAERMAELPVQPAAGKLEYAVEVSAPGESHQLPAQGTVVLRYKDPVPAALLIAHVVCMFFGVFVGIRTGLAAIHEPVRFRTLAWVTLACLTLGGMVLGPLVQKYAFGALWTGWPFGYDLTDNKTLIMWLLWVAACATMGWRAGTRDKAGRWAAGLASLAMIWVYLVPHSMRGSELDYAKLDRGTHPGQSVTTGR